MRHSFKDSKITKIWYGKAYHVGPRSATPAAADGSARAFEQRARPVYADTVNRDLSV
ncbi:MULTISPECIES: hypothetical protein [Streptosporangium]|uniref:Uncharacterized protein n=1 Tax=Streptosporangium brasiliense TaxID=47480 RepID=A0ABT9RK63_9ACTN|nr:hypothetical protein [Streptosporangium brasiliense]MDP9869211.1 hypothetical protein [Streptosporangium brasiliense]